MAVDTSFFGNGPMGRSGHLQRPASLLYYMIDSLPTEGVLPVERPPRSGGRWELSHRFRVAGMSTASLAVSIATKPGAGGSFG